MNFRLMAALILVVSLPTFLDWQNQKSEQSQTKVPKTGKSLLSSGAGDSSTDPLQLMQSLSQDETRTGPVTAPSQARVEAARAAEKEAGTNSESDFTPISFDLLAGFPYELGEGAPEDMESHEWAQKLDEQFPDEVLEYDDSSIEIEGYIIPVDFKNGKIMSFVLVSSPMACCFGVVPEINEWVHVNVQEGISSLLVDIPLLVRGTIDIGADVQSGSVLSLYRVEASSVKVSPSANQH